MSRFTFRIVRAAAAVAAVALAAACGGGDGPSAPPPPPVPGSLNVTLTGSDGKAVENAAVTVANGTGAQAGAGATDASGAFQLANLQPGAYTVSVKAPAGFSPAALQKQATVANGAATAVPFAVQVATSDKVTIGGGATDTVALGRGMVAQVAVPAGAAPVEVTLTQAGAVGPPELDALAPPATLQVTAAGGALRGGAAGAAAEAAPVTVTVWNRVPTCAAGRADMAFEVGKESDGTPVFLYSEPACTTWTDPSTGRSGAAYVNTTDVPVGSALNLKLFGKDRQCILGERKLYPYPGITPDSSKTPVILIHGWQPKRLSCLWFLGWEPAGTFSALAESFKANLTGDYQLYVLRYPTVEHVSVAVSFLHDEIVRRGWDKRDVVLVGHSMGGLVGRGYLAAYGPEHVRAVITLGTPHLGSPVADDGAAQRDAIRSCYGLKALVGKWLYPESDGYHDLSPTSAWIQALAGQRGGADRVYTFGGATTGEYTGKCVLDRLLAGASETRNDGIVPLTSALPDWTTLQTVMDGSDHSQITETTVAPVTNTLRQLARCVPGTIPEPPAANGFPFSGTLARQSGGRIDVVLNPISVDGVPQRGLAKSAFTVVENGCLKPFEITTSEGNLGVDLVFIQDLSGSMSSAITGVRNSVLTFASTLASRGLNVRIGSVGFSGPGTLVTHANESTCERVGPVQDLASPETFRGHVAGSWFATGGCDDPENALEAVKYAHEHMTWRSGAARVYILVTDVSIHTAATVCNGLGPCTDQTLESIVGLVGGSATIHAIAPSALAQRTRLGGLDPWLLADRTGGARLTLPSNGVVDLNALGIADRVADIVRLTFTSTSTDRARHRIRIRVQAAGKVAELSPGLIAYDVDRTLSRSPRR
ncbi:MAG TPA: alpha/beta fold hydrolase [Longimicrobium sp.]|nr:alpha/beta fold hydrolase [Longimicrobium sp.]